MVAATLKHDPIPPLLQAGNAALTYFVRRDLLRDEPGPLESLWQLPEPLRLVRKQQEDGSWKYPGGNASVRSQEDYNQIETYRNLGILVEMYGLTKQHPAISAAAGFLFSRQTDDGDFRGIYGNQYSPNYTAGITELLTKAGYADDERIGRVFAWLLGIRQDDGGWAIPLRTVNARLDVISGDAETIEPDVTKPYSHMVTGVVLRAFAAHPAHCRSKEARRAGRLLLASLFSKDKYQDRQASDFWTRFSFPFWFTDLISALDSLSLLGFDRTEPQIDRALRWFIDNQVESGSWNLKVLKGQNQDVLRHFLALAILRSFNRYI